MARCENHPKRPVEPPSRVLCHECLLEAYDDVRDMATASMDPLIHTILVTAEERYLVEKARDLRLQRCAYVTTNHGVLMTYEEHRRLTEDH